MSGLITLPTSKTFTKYRNEIYGVAAILIIFYHTYCVAHWDLFKVFSFGFIGVDLFLIIGGGCLCYSIQNKSLGHFYLNRLKRIYPLWFFVWFICVYPIRIFIAGENISLLDALWEGTVVLPLITGYGDCDWFTAAILLYYLVFPLLFKIINSRNYLYVYIFTLIAIIVLLSAFNFNWEQKCAISRLPCFIIAIIWYRTCFNKKSIMGSLVVSLIFCLVAIYFKYAFLLATTLSPGLIILLISFFSFVNRNSASSKFIPLQWFGKRSLECYYGSKGNSYLLNSVYMNPILGSCAFLIYVTLGTLFLSIVNKILKKTF